MSRRYHLSITATLFRLPFKRNLCLGISMHFANEYHSSYYVCDLMLRDGAEWRERKEVLAYATSSWMYFVSILSISCHIFQSKKKKKWGENDVRSFLLSCIFCSLLINGALWSNLKRISSAKISMEKNEINSHCLSIGIFVYCVSTGACNHLKRGK